MTKALTLAIAWLALGAVGFTQDPASRPTKETEAEAARVAKLVELTKLYDSVATKQAAGDAKGALAASDEAVRTFGNEFNSTGGIPDPQTFDLYKQLIKRTDELVEKVESAEYEAQIPWRDILSPKERSPWGHSQGSKLTWGESSATVEGVPIEHKKFTGVVSILPPKATPWNDLVIDLEFTLISGELEMYLRYWPDKRSYRIRFAPQDGFELGKRHTVTIGVKGSTISFHRPGNPINRDTMMLATSRTGGIGFGLNLGSKAEISKLQLKVLR